MSDASVEAIIQEMKDKYPDELWQGTYMDESGENFAEWFEEMCERLETESGLHLTREEKITLGKMTVGAKEIGSGPDRRYEY